MVKSPKKVKKSKKEETHEIETIAKNAGLRIGRDNPSPKTGDCQDCVDHNAPGAKIMEELLELHKYMHGKDVPEEKKENRKWIESKCL